ncbi:unnamed protein product [Rangifer tarandus platyrhynchus]|uniref:Uncharacterized protein n=1 Tax=Rangifer tarandus platyrhynchus TaxID=3082113 RepID=A0AC60A4Y8_RANTA
MSSPLVTALLSAYSPSLPTHLVSSSVTYSPGPSPTPLPYIPMKPSKTGASPRLDITSIPSADSLPDSFCLGEFNQSHEMRAVLKEECFRGRQRRDRESILRV